MKNLIVFFILLAGITCSAQDVAWKKPHIEKHVLENGLTVILNVDHEKPVVYGIVVAKVGAKDDSPDATGMAHYMEHMLFKGTEDMGTIDWKTEKPHIDRIVSLYEELGKTTNDSLRKEIQKKINDESLEANKYAIPNEMDKLIKTIGGIDMNANTSPDRTVFYNAFPPNQLEKWLEMYSSRFVNPVFRGFQSELEVVYEEKNLYSDMFQFKLFEEFNKLFFKNHPYGQQSLIGTIDHLKNPSLNKMYEFYKTYYVANNMALILSGDFNKNEALNLIREKFGKWQSGKLPEKKKYEEQPFQGREFVVKKLSPIKIAFLGYRTPAAGHEDEIALEVCNGILSNENQTGLLDKLTIENKLMAAMVLTMPYNDHGESLFLIIPKILGQKLESAEALVAGKIKELREGKFDDWLVGAIKSELYRNFMLEMESAENRGMYLAEIFGQNKEPDEIYEIPDKIMAVTKEKVIEIANKYYGDNFLAFYSKMGFPKKEKIDKPGYKPVIANTEAKSEFAKHLENVPVKPISENFIDFRSHIQFNRIKRGILLYRTENPYNNIFSLKIKYGMGEAYHPLLKNAAELANLAGTKDLKVNEFKNEFSKIGCTYSIRSNRDYLEIELEGEEKNLKQALSLLYSLVQNPVAEPDKIDVIVQGEKTNRKLERSEPDNVAEALFAWMRFGNKSNFIDRPGIKQLKKASPDSLLSVFKLATKFEAEVHYAGKTSYEELLSYFKTGFIFPDNPSKSLAPANLTITKYYDNTIYLVDKSKSLQSKIYFMMNQKPYYNDDDPYIDAFNLYFGGDFSGIVMQEVREYRSLAYAAGAIYAMPKQTSRESVFYGYIGTQSDKTIEAVRLYDSLVNIMPLKPERIDFMKEYLVQSAITDRPGFRDLSETISRWKLRGYTYDPAMAKIPVYYELTFDDVVKFYSENIKMKPMAIGIVGDAKRIDIKELEKYGEVVIIKEKSLFTD